MARRRKYCSATARAHCRCAPCGGLQAMPGVASGGVGYALSAVVRARDCAVSRAVGSATLSEVAKGSISSGA